MYTFETHINLSKARHTELLIKSRTAPFTGDSRIGQAARERTAKIFRWMKRIQTGTTYACESLELSPCC
jgi:hypothetical protein